LYELIPIFSGVLAGLLAARVAGRRLRSVLIAAVALVAALTAGLLSGELAESWPFLLWDTAQAVGAALLVLAAPRLIAKRAD
jgi:MFS family permease